MRNRQADYLGVIINTFQVSLRLADPGGEGGEEGLEEGLGILVDELAVLAAYRHSNGSNAQFEFPIGTRPAVAAAPISRQANDSRPSRIHEACSPRNSTATAIAASDQKQPEDANANAAAKAGKRTDGDFVYSLGLSLSKEGKVSDTRWDSPAFNAGIGTGMTVVAVNDVEYSSDALAEAVRGAKGGKTPIRLLVKDFNRYRDISIDYLGGLRYPALERIEGTRDWLTPIFTARK